MIMIFSFDNKIKLIIILDYENNIGLWKNYWIMLIIIGFDNNIG